MFEQVHDSRAVVQYYQSTFIPSPGWSREVPGPAWRHACCWGVYVLKENGRYAGKIYWTCLASEECRRNKVSHALVYAHVYLRDAMLGGIPTCQRIVI